MPHIITRKIESVEQNWLKQLANAISDPEQLLNYLDIDPSPWQQGFKARKLFPQRVPVSFADRMEKGNPYDPLLRQVLPLSQEFEIHAGYSADPLQEQENIQPGLLHKYSNRVLLIVKGACAINCRYCFRRHFPYQDNQGNKTVWENNLTYIAQHPEVTEVILSGGDPLMAKDHELAWLIQQISAIPHIRILRIHSRLPVVIPDRVTPALVKILAETSLDTVFVSHINHPNEIDNALRSSLTSLRQVGITLLNQAVLLKGINDTVATQVALNETLFRTGVLPYYLHVLDKVRGAAHFLVPDNEAKAIMAGVIEKVPGYLVPRLTREIGGRKSKTPLDLNLE
jgi:EF-P beta-lysylation protein EpmB